MRYQVFSVLLVLTLCLTHVQAQSGFDIFVNIEGVTGSEEASYTDPSSWIPARVVSEGLMNQVGFVVFGGGGGGAGGAEFQDVTFTKEIDLFTPRLHVSVASGAHFPRMLLDLVRGGESAYAFRIELEELQFSGVELRSNEDPEREKGIGPCSKLPYRSQRGGLIDETVSVGFERICWSVPGSRRCWDLRGNIEP